MTQDSISLNLARIEKALARIEAHTQNNGMPMPLNDAKYQTLRSRTQAALASLENVIAQASGGRA